MNWKKIEELNRTGHILVLCKDNTGIYHQMMTIVIENNKRTFYQNIGIIGTSVRVFPDKVKAAIYLDEICPNEVINKFCYDKEKEEKEEVEYFNF